MIDNLRVIAMIPARGGSKGIPRKNIRELAGKAMIGYTIDAALESRYIDDVLVSTDDEEIAAIAKCFGADVPFLRPAELAADTSKTVDAIVHARDWLRKHGREYDIIVLLQATSPLRTAQDLDAALELFVAKGRNGLVSVTKVTESPILMSTMSDDNVLHPIMSVSGTVRRQDMPVFYRVNGAIYINDFDAVSLDTSFNDNPVGYVMDAESSTDVDEMKDFEQAERLLLKRRA